MGAARHAGFAAVTTVGADFVNGMLAGAANLVPPVTFALPTVIAIGGDNVGLNGSLSITPATVSFASNPQNLVSVTLGASGKVRLTANGSNLVEVTVTLSTTLQVALFVSVSPSSVTFGIDLSNANVTALDVIVTLGPPLAAIYSAALQSGPVLSALSSGLRSVPKTALTFTVPGVTGTLSYSFGGVTVTVPVSRVVVVPIDGNVGAYPNNTGGCLDIALDVASFTNGDASQLVNLITTPGPTGAGYSVDQFGNVGFAGDGTGIHASSGGTNLAAVVNTGFFTSVVNTRIAPQIAHVIPKGLISSLSVSTGAVTAALNSNLPTLQYNCLTVDVSGSYDGAGFSFSASFTPVAVEISQPYRLSYSMWLVAYNWSVSILVFIDLLLAIIFPWLGVILDLIINSTLDSFIANEVNLVSPGFSLSGTGTLPYPGLSGWSVQYWVDDMAVSNSEISGYMAVQVVGPPPPAPPPPAFLLSSPPHQLTDPSPLQVSLQVNDPDLLDPLLGLHIAWTAVRNDTGATVLNQDSPLTSAGLSIAINRWTGDLIYNDQWNVTCEVYRPADALTQRYSYFKSTIATGVSDVVDRHHPYVLWEHSAFFHDPSGPGMLKQHPLWSRSRKSRIHRTDLLIRCIALNEAFTTGYPQETGKGLVEPKLSAPLPQYLDSLSGFGTLDDAEKWRRGVLCDYCFFGGPTKTTWKTPTPPTPVFV